MAFSKIIFNNTTLMDITDTTAAAKDVESGKYFYGADGVKTAGIFSGPEFKSGQITLSAKTQSISIETGCTARFFVLAVRDRVNHFGHGYKTTSLIFVDFDTGRELHINSNNGDTSTLGWGTTLGTAACNASRSGTVVTLSSNATTGNAFGYFMNTTYDWFAFDAE